MDRTNQKKILIADDEQSLRSLVRRFLGDKYIVLEAMDGEAAIHVARSYKPDIILMDIMMPKMDGYTACYRIKKDRVTKAIPVVMVTALGYKLNVKLGKEMGADGYIAKPFDAKQLKKEINRILSQGE